METLKAIGIYDENKGMTVVAGCDNKLDPSIPDKQIILHGNCTRRHLKEHPDAYFLPGCPPGEGSLYMTVVRKEAVTGQPELMPWDPPADGGRRPRLARLCGEGGCQVLWNRQTLIRAMCSWTTPRS